MVQFTENTAMRALCADSHSLRTAGVTGVWVDMNGAGWTQTYWAIIETEQKPGREHVVALRYFDPFASEDGTRSIWLEELCPKAQQAVETALADLDPGEQVILKFVVRERYVGGVKIWPISDLTNSLRERIATMQAEIAKLEAVEAAR
jgi:hypothetical protein